MARIPIMGNASANVGPMNHTIPLTISHSARVTRQICIPELLLRLRQ